MICIGKYEFSQEDYEMYKSFFENRLDKIKIVSIDSVNQKHDKTFKEILRNKKEMAKFLEQFIEMEVKEEDIEKHNSSFINKHYERRESDIIYKMKNKEIYYLIEHQSTVDKKMPKSILEYCMEIMREFQGNKKEETNPLIVPIVIYTGIRKWTVPTDFSETQKVEERYKKYKIRLQYVFPEILGEEIERILEIIEEKEKSNMQDLVKRIKSYEERREKRLINKGIKETITSMVINMLKFNESEEKIIKYTNVKKEEIEKIKKQLEIQPN